MIKRFLQNRMSYLGLSFVLFIGGAAADQHRRGRSVAGAVLARARIDGVAAAILRQRRLLYPPKAS